MKTNTSQPDTASEALGTSKADAAPAKAKRPRRMAREPSANAASAAASEPSAKPQAEARGESKIAGVLALLKREQGVTLAELVEATGWLPHTTRAALTGLRKKGHVIGKTSREGTTVYAIGTVA